LSGAQLGVANQPNTPPQQPTSASFTENETTRLTGGGGGGGGKADGNQSVTPRPKRGSKQMRIRMPEATHRYWQAIKPARMRQRLIASILAAAAEGIDLQRLTGMLPELRKLRQDTHTLVKVALIHKVPLNAHQAQALINRLDNLLGGQP